MQIVNGSVYTGASRSIDLWSVSEAIFLSEIMCVHVVCVWRILAPVKPEASIWELAFRNDGSAPEPKFLVYPYRTTWA